MKLKRLAASAVAVVTGVLGLGLAAAGPAAAATGTWRAYGNTNPISSSTSFWSCGITTTVTTNVLAQVYVIRAVGSRFLQAAVIVRNNRSSLYAVEAAADLETITAFVNRWECPRSGVGANSWSVCFGQTLNFPDDVVRSRGGANGVDLGYSPWD
jgi:hypothetical protein